MSRALRLGIFIAATLAIFAAGLFWIGSGQLRFTETYRLNADFQNVAGLTPGASVRVGGLHEGVVHRIVLPTRPDQKVRVEMDLRGATHSVIKKDSIATIETEGLIGDEYVEITFGSVDAAAVKNGDTIGSAPPLQISDVVKKADNLLDSAQGMMQNVDLTADNLKSISSKLNSGQGSAGALINSRALYNHINDAAANLQEDTEAMKHNFLLRGFFKNRGYEDSTELKRNAIAELPSGTPEKLFSYRAAKLFDKADSAKLKDGKALEDAGKFLESNAFRLAVVAAYSDMKGDSGQDTQLDQARAAVARDYLVQHFKIDDTHVKTIGMGKSSDAPDGGALQVLVYSPAKSTR